MSNMVLKKTFNFSVNSIEVYRTLIAKSEYVLSKQFLRASTSIGANVREAQRAQSKKDFLSKINIALKEADETLYWIELLYATNYLDNILTNSIQFESKKSNSLLSFLIHNY